ncbi:alpha-L-fucosidase [Biomphalaria pfeifferi]|uniref:alpha-L-fucosidase n=1 Tax=Biomphalaria pfeifferi TaxID=112525 RepID=A0AAD8EZX9_BIOPF|nr:alpha-L-fucosidase [Biomphalaria pfeifferi]
MYCGECWLILLLAIFSFTARICESKNVQRYEPNWQSLDARPLPPWYDEAKIGIFLHWGVFSVPSYVGAWFWWYWKGTQPNLAVVEFMKQNYPPSFTYADFAPEFTAEFYNPNQWADIFKASGAQYVVLTTKHHEGFCLWPSKYSWNWNSMDVGPKRDLVGELATALRKNGLKFGAYHSLFEFFNPLFLKDQENNFTTQEYVRTKTMPELYELVNNYKPDLIWSDGEWMALDTYWNSTNFLAWLYNDSPVKDTVVTNDRWGSNTMCKHGGYLTCNDKFNPKVKQDRKFEDSTTMDKYAWTYRRNLKLSDIHSIEEVLEIVAQVVSCGGNLLINVGPTKEGTIVPIFEERLRQMGEWLGVNGEAIYATKPWSHQNDSVNANVWYTSKKTDNSTNVYAIVLKWPSGPNLILADPLPSLDTVVTLLGYPDTFKWKGVGSGMVVSIPPIPINQIPCKWAWVFKLTNIKN